MYLVRLVYASRATDSMRADDIANILEASKRNNAKVDLTGMLIFNSSYFLQCIEGNRVAVNTTYQRILNDARHAQPELLDYREVSEREFPEWSMGYIGESKFLTKHILKFSGASEFNPYELSGESAHNLLVAACEAVPMI